MDRDRALAVVFSVLGVVSCLCGMVLLYVGPSLVADARTENLAGPGLSLWVLDPWPAPGTTARLWVEAHGGSRAGIERASVRRDGAVVADADGKGATWGTRIVESHERGAEVVTLALPIPADAAPDQAVPYTVDVDYVVAMSSGSTTFTDASFHDALTFELAPRTAAGATRLRWLQVGKAAGVLGGWFVVLLVSWRVSQRFDHLGEALGPALIGILLMGGMAGYWLFARPLCTVIGDPPYLAEGLATAFVVLPAVAAYRVNRWLPGD